MHTYFSLARAFLRFVLGFLGFFKTYWKVSSYTTGGCNDSFAPSEKSSLLHYCQYLKWYRIGKPHYTLYGYM